MNSNNYNEMLNNNTLHMNSYKRYNTCKSKENNYKV